MSDSYARATSSNTTNAAAYYQATKERLAKIQSHLSESPRGTRLKGKVCIVTGVGSLKGIGRASAILFAHEGAKHLYLVDFDKTNLPNLKETIEKRYTDVKVTVQQGDASDEAFISGLCQRALKEEGRLDVFFANAGVASANALQDTTAETFMNVMRVNALSCFLAVKHASAAMQVVNASRGKTSSAGSIVLTASIAGIRSGAGTTDCMAFYSSYVNSIAQTSIYQLQKTNVRVNSICPGLIETNMTVHTFDFARKRGADAKIGQLNPLARYGVPEEIAQVALFLASDDSSYVNGQNWAVDAGLSSSHPVIPGRWA
uniref:NAD(P)-binding protein n=1 Tax=Mycena chlorophos TaxID=658473 RepID=A0ABQ0M0G4_MYCCL|nr:predicted protein [Mycena chlorophos]